MEINNDKEKYSLDEINPYVLIAALQGLTFHEKREVADIFIDKDGNKFVLTRLGFIPNERLPSYLEIEKAKAEVKKAKADTAKIQNELESVSEQLVKARKTMIAPEDIMGKKTKSTIKRIINSDLSNEDKISNMIDYLKL